MDKIVEESQCTGCGTCYSVCSHEAITMQFDAEGFEYPVINQNVCVDCGLCQASCPVVNYNYDKRIKYSDVQIGYAARNKNLEQRLISSSGSIFPVLAEYIIDKGGIVVGVAYDEQFNTRHLIVDKIEDLPKLQGSKYLQCTADNITFKYIRNELNYGRLVLYSAMACQVEGLKAYLRKAYENLYTIDLICMGIPSSKVWQTYLKTFFTAEKIFHVNFKEKSIGWNSFCFHIETDKRTFKEKGMKNLYLQSMFRTWNMRPSCFNCPFKKEKRISDFTIADCWGANKLVPQIDDNRGLSSVIVHSKKGIALWKQVEDKLETVKISIEEIAKGNSNLISNKQKAGDRERFYYLLRKTPKNAFLKLCSVHNETFSRRVLHKIKTILRPLIV